jgi:putative FmdB family regulatory protein
MPTYEFKCPKGHVFERFYPTITNTRRLKCPQCGKMADRLISGGAGLVFKGSGFYITDYKRKGEKPDTGEKTEKTEKVAKPAESTPKPNKQSKDSSSDK